MLYVNIYSFFFWNNELQKQNNVKILHGVQINDEDGDAPLLPPDEITVNGIFYTIDNISDGRGWYNNLRKWDSDSKYKKRKYLKGSFHNTCYKYKNCNVYDWRIDGDMDLIIRLHDGTKTIIKVRKAEKDILSSMKKLHMRLKDEQPNCRGNKLNQTKNQKKIIG